jgi:hypothetical protein
VVLIRQTRSNFVDTLFGTTHYERIDDVGDEGDIHVSRPSGASL